jgi:hypothetical protein
VFAFIEALTTHSVDTRRSATPVRPITKRGMTIASSLPSRNLSTITG